MEIPKYENLNSSNCTERSIKIHYPEFWNYILNNFPAELKWTEKLYWYYNHITEIPKCPICGKIVKYINLQQGYREFCSHKCLNKSIEIQNRKRQTSIKHYGAENPMQSKSIQEKVKQTNLKKYGEDNIFKTNQFKTQLKQKNQEKFGVDYYLQTKECRNKIKQTCLKKYGVEHNTQIPEIKNRVKLKWENELLNRDPYIIKFEDEYIIRKCSNTQCNLCKEKQYKILRYLYNSRWNHEIEICPIKNPIGIFGKDTSIEIFVKDILDKYNIEYKTNVRNIISPKELDIYIPSKNIAIECNGCYWHSTIYKDNQYHYKKFKNCLDLDIQLLTIWQDQIITKPQIMKSIILSKLGIYNNRIFARKCEIKQVPAKEANLFLNNNHLQGHCPSSIKLGLYYNNELVSLMTFSQTRLGIGLKNNSMELVRFCNKLDTQVIGGASKLFKYFVKIYNPSSVISFSSNDISNGGLYDKLNFIKESETPGSYWYINPNTNKRYHRFRFRKSELIKMGADPNKSEAEIMRETKYLKVYDSGQMKWIWKNE